MGKRQHQKDKMYITCAEYTHFYGGKKPAVKTIKTTITRALS
ncbi:PPIL2 isoform 3 [Pan troglodytes]|uniref:Peptidylprolyl isomerase like 2 n=3 Tax=Hominidae TaxID=9604 RepID=F8WC56_HUMAN|nr:PPIL2 isoform 3 [Pan troglodytes]PNJ13865.1 PPIL2 isoform 3 [Pongo abelii]